MGSAWSSAEDEACPRIGAQELIGYLGLGHLDPALKVFHNRLAATKKKPKAIIVAVMRKMITTLNAMVRDNAAWQPRAA